MSQFPQKSIFQQSVYRYGISSDRADQFLFRTEEILEEVAESFGQEVERSLDYILRQLEDEFGQRVEASEQAMFWMRDHLARVLSSAESAQEKREVEDIFLAQLVQEISDA